jgi:hypothetical protein
MASLQERPDEFKRAFESGAPLYNAPHEAIETMHRATVELKASGIEERAPKVGDRAPSFTLFNEDHALVALNGLLREHRKGTTQWQDHNMQNERRNRSQTYAAPNCSTTLP